MRLFFLQIYKTKFGIAATVQALKRLSSLYSTHCELQPQCRPQNSEIIISLCYIVPCNQSFPTKYKNLGPIYKKIILKTFNGVLNIFFGSFFPHTISLFVTFEGFLAVFGVYNLIFVLSNVKVWYLASK